MIVKIKEFFTNRIGLFDRLQACEEELIAAQELNDELLEQLRDQIELSKDPRHVLSTIIEGGIEWYDYMDMEPPQREEYERQAKDICRNPVFLNEINFMTNNYAKIGLEKAKEPNALLTMQISALSIRAIETRIREIMPIEIKPDPSEEPFEAV